jgi:hypothetical protein
VPSVEEVGPAGWAAVFDDMVAEVVAPAFFRREPRLRARAYLLGLVSGLERKNGWTLAEFAGDATPDGMQRLLNAACWDADGSVMGWAGMWPLSWGTRGRSQSATKITWSSARTWYRVLPGPACRGEGQGGPGREGGRPGSDHRRVGRYAIRAGNIRRYLRCTWRSGGKVPRWRFIPGDARA